MEEVKKQFVEQFFNNFFSCSEHNKTLELGYVSEIKETDELKKEYKFLNKSLGVTGDNAIYHLFIVKKGSERMEVIVRQLGNVRDNRFRRYDYLEHISSGRWFSENMVVVM